jgi:hypothetical protein
MTDQGARTCCGNSSENRLVAFSCLLVVYFLRNSCFTCLTSTVTRVGADRQTTENGRAHEIEGGTTMIKVRTFTNELKIFHTMNELAELENQVNQFIEENGVEKVVSVSDTCTLGEGNTCGIIRVLTYEAP